MRSQPHLAPGTRRIVMAFAGDAALRERIRLIAYNEDRTLSAVMHDLVREALERRQQREQREGQPDAPTAA